MKILKKLVAVLAIILIGLILAKNIIAKTAVTSAVKAITGLDLKIRGINIGLLNTSIGINDLKLYNPANFKDRLMVDLPEAYVDYDLGAFFRKQVHLEEIRLNLKELIVVKNEAGELNLNWLKSAQKGRTKDTTQEADKDEMPEIKIDVLKLKISKVIYKDYSKGEPPKTREFNINIGERHENITDPNALVSLIVTKALMKSALGNSVDFDTSQLQERTQQAVGKAKETATKAVEQTREALAEQAAKAQEAMESTVDKASETIKDLLPFGQE